MIDLPDLSAMALPGSTLAVRVTPKASRDRIVVEGPSIRIYVTTAPQDGKATEAARALLAKALGVPKTTVRLLHGATTRDKVFGLD